MNNKPITQSRDSDLRHSHAALLRAALRARELARQTGTRLIITYQGNVQHIVPEPLSVAETFADTGKGAYDPEAGRQMLMPRDRLEQTKKTKGR